MRSRTIRAGLALPSPLILGDNGNAGSERPYLRLANTITANEHAHGVSDETNFFPEVWAITAVTGDDVIAAPGHTIATGSVVSLSSLVSATGFTANTVSYYAVNVVAGVSFQLSLTLGGAAVAGSFTTGNANVRRGYAFLDGIQYIGDSTATLGSRGVVDHVVAGAQARARSYADYLGTLYGNVTILRVEAGTTNEVQHYRVGDVTKAGGATVTTQYGLLIPSLIGATNNVSIASNGSTTRGWHAGAFVFGYGLWPHDSAILEAQSTTKGFLFPRMTTAQKTAIASPAAGLVVYDTTLNKLCLRTASAWETITSV